MLLALVLAGCAPEAPAPPEPPEQAEAPAAAEPDSTRIVAMVAPLDERTLRFQLRAPPGQSLYLDNCGGAFPWGLEREVGGAWEPAWGATINECHSAPLVVAPGEVLPLTGTVRLDPGETLPAGRYRVALYGLFTRHDQENHNENPRVEGELRASEPFDLGPLTDR